MLPPDSTISHPSSAACSVSSVTVPAGSPAAIGVARGRRVEAVDEHAVALHDLRPRRRLGRHAERVAHGEAVQGSAGPVARHSTSALATTCTSGP